MVFTFCDRVGKDWAKTHSIEFNSDDEICDYIKHLYHVNFVKIIVEKNVRIVIARNPFGLTLNNYHNALVEVGGVFDNREDYNNNVDRYLNEGFHETPMID